MLIATIVLATMCITAYAVVKVRPVRIRVKLLTYRGSPVRTTDASAERIYKSEVTRLYRTALVALDEGYTYEQLLEWLRRQFPTDIEEPWTWTEVGRQRCMRILSGRPRHEDYRTFIPTLCNMTKGRDIIGGMESLGFHAKGHDCQTKVMKDMEEELGVPEEELEDVEVDA